MAVTIHILSLIACLIGAAVGTSLDSWSTRLDDSPMQDDGLVLTRVCNGPNNACSLPLTGPNISIWNGDGSCTYMYVGCSLTGMSLQFFSPSQTSNVWITWMGGADPSPSNLPRDPKCTKHNELNPGTGFGQITTTTTLFDRDDCNTAFGQTPQR